MEEESAFIKTFGNSPIIRVLDFLIEGGMFDYTPTDIAKNSDVNWGTMQKILPLLENAEIIIKTRKIGRGQLYKLNKDNLIVKKLLELDMAISDFFVQKELEEQAIAVPELIK